VRTHPPSLVTLTRRAIADHALFGAGSRVLVAVSGGVDSTALLHVLATLRSKIGHDLVAHGVDHGLRERAESELDGVEALASELEVPFARTVLRVAPGGNLQSRARDARLAALRDAASRAGACCVATGHHADDRAETVLIRLLRGASPGGLAVLPPRAGDLVRPFIRARRADITAHLERHGLRVAHDPSNHDPRFLRARVRLELIPLLEQLSPGIVGHLNGLADDLGADLADAHDAGPGQAWPPLPRAPRVALASLAASRSLTAHVELPHGLIVRYAPPARKRS
jgi:tRNA(Ile)-lysidine synthase